MIELDSKDKKILYHLTLDARQSYNEISKKTKIPKNVIDYRIKRLEDTHVIIGYQTLINFFNLGYTGIRVYFCFQYINPEIRQQIIDHFISNPVVTIVESIDGSYDLTVYFITRDVHDLYPFWQQTMQKFGNYFSSIKMSIYIGEYYYPHSYLLDESDTREKYIIREKKHHVTADDTDLDILRELSLNPRIPSLEIAQNIGVSTLTVRNHIKHLRDTGIILGYRVRYDPKTFGYDWYKIDLYLKEYHSLHRLIAYLEQNSHLSSIDQSMGYADLELELYLKNSDELHRLLEELMKRFPDIIKNSTYFRCIKDHKRVNLFTTLDTQKKSQYSTSATTSLLALNHRLKICFSTAHIENYDVRYEHMLIFR